MAINLHVAKTRFVPVNTVTGLVVDKNSPTVTIGETLRTRSEHRVVPDASLPHTANWPNLTAYLTAELPFSLVKLTQSLIITSDEVSAVTVHVAYLQLLPVDSIGNVIDKNSPTTTVKRVLATSGTEPRVIVNAGIANTAGNPTIKAYLEAEAAAGFTLKHIDQTMIITYS